jgi:hypothetical protein
MKGRGLATLIVTALVLIALEGLTRLIWTDPLGRVSLENAAYAFHPWAGYRVTPGFNFRHLRINRYGWRGPEPIRTKPSGTWRVLLLGDSVAFSSFWVSDNATVAGYLQALLARATSRPSEVLNMAQPGGLSEVSLATHSRMKVSDLSPMSSSGSEAITISASRAIASRRDSFLDRIRRHPTVTFRMSAGRAPRSQSRGSTTRGQPRGMR